jgi:hypothetical protein
MIDGPFHVPQVDFSQCENSSELLPFMPPMLLPVGGDPTRSIPGDAFLVALIEGREAPIGVIAVGQAGTAAFYVGATAGALRNFAAQALRAADLVDGGKGKQ